MDAASLAVGKPRRVPAIPRAYVSSDLESPALQVTRTEMMSGLERDGYFIIRSAMSPEQCDAVADALWTYIETVSPTIKRTDPKTLLSKDRPIHAGGLIQAYNAGFQEAGILTRQWTKHVFAELYGTGILQTSFDGFSLTAKNKRCRYANEADWQTNVWQKDSMHVDQTTPGFQCVQGGVAITDQKEDEHVFLCVPGSHLVHAEVMQMGPAKKTPFWEVMSDAQKAFVRERGLKPKRIPLQRGEMVLWDSRLVHSSSPYFATADANAVRIQMFACMLPLEHTPLEKRPEQKRKRARAYEVGVVGKHSPDLVRLFGHYPRTWGAPQNHLCEPASAEMSDDERKLHGLVPY